MSKINSIDLLKNDIINDFIYSNNSIKLLIGDRITGKTSSLVLDAFKKVYMEKHNALFITTNSGHIEYIEKLFMNFCNEYNASNITVIRKNKVNRCIKINNNILTIMSISHFNDNCRGLRFNNVYIDEPTFIINIREVMQNIRRILVGEKSQIIIAGTINKTSDIINFLKDENYSYKTYVLDKSMNNILETQILDGFTNNTRDFLISPDSFITSYKEISSTVMQNTEEDILNNNLISRW